MLLGAHRQRWEVRLVEAGIEADQRIPVDGCVPTDEKVRSDVLSWGQALTTLRTTNALVRPAPRTLQMIWSPFGVLSEPFARTEQCLSRRLDELDAEILEELVEIGLGLEVTICCELGVHDGCDDDTPLLVDTPELGFASLGV